MEITSREVQIFNRALVLGYSVFEAGRLLNWDLNTAIDVKHLIWGFLNPHEFSYSNDLIPDNDIPELDS